MGGAYTGVLAVTDSVRFRTSRASNKDMAALGYSEGIRAIEYHTFVANIEAFVLTLDDPYKCHRSRRLPRRMVAVTSTSHMIPKNLGGRLRLDSTPYLMVRRTEPLIKITIQAFESSVHRVIAHGENPGRCIADRVYHVRSSPIKKGRQRGGGNMSQILKASVVTISPLNPQLARRYAGRLTVSNQVRQHVKTQSYEGYEEAGRSGGEPANVKQDTTVGSHRSGSARQHHTMVCLKFQISV